MSTSNNNNNKRRALPSPSNSYKRHKKFILPPRAKNLPVVQKLNALLGDKKVEVETPPLPPPIATAVEQPKESYECSLCAEVLYAPYPKPLKRLLDAVKKNEQEYKKEQEQDYQKLVEKCKLEGQSFIPPFTYIKGGLSKNDQAVICRVHKVELIYKPLAKEKGYPQHIEFEKIDDRIKLFKQELIDIIEGKIASSFLEKELKIHQKLGSVKARQAKELINRFDDSLPGYYGNRGSHYIMETVSKLFLLNKIDNNILNKEKTKPLTPIEYLQKVLVPESGIRLIKQDMNITDNENAKKIMIESTEYGSIVYNKIKKRQEIK